MLSNALSLVICAILLMALYKVERAGRKAGQKCSRATQARTAAMQGRIEELQRDTARPLEDLVAAAERVAQAEFDRAYGAAKTSAGVAGGGGCWGSTTTVSGGGGSPAKAGYHAGSPADVATLRSARQAALSMPGGLRERRRAVWTLAKNLADRAAEADRAFTAGEDDLWNMLTGDIDMLDQRISALSALSEARERRAKSLEPPF